jgi:hypothetical protein
MTRYALIAGLLRAGCVSTLRLATSILLATMANAYSANIASEILPNGKHILDG